jgi:hypothetical protein
MQGEKTRSTAHEKRVMRVLSSDDGYSLVERNEDQCWLYKDEEEEFSGYISLSGHREERTREEVTAGFLRSGKKGGEMKLHTRRRGKNQEE